LTQAITFKDTDASTVIQSVLNALTPGRTWKEKVVLKGSFPINKPFVVPSYTLLEIDGYLVKTEANPNDMVQLSGYHIEIRGGVINADKKGGAGSIIRAVGDTDDVKIVGTRILNYVERGIWLHEAYTHGRVILDNVYVQFSETLPEYKSGSWGFFGANLSELFVTRSRFNNIGTDALEAHVSRICVLDGVVVTNTATGGIHVAPTDPGAQIIVQNCYVYNTASHKGLAIGKDDGSVLTYGAVVRNCRFKKIGGQSAIRLQHAYNSLIDGNYIEDVTGYGIVVALAGEGNVFTRNVIRNVTDGGIYTRAYSLIKGNSVNNAKYGFQLYNGVHSIIENNFLDNITSYKMYLQGDTTGIKIRHNVGYPTENSGIATIPAGETSVTVAHGLVATPSKVIVTPRGNIGAVWVSARNATDITINCETAPTIDTIVDWYAEV